MLTCLPEITVDDLAAPASKRRRLNSAAPIGRAVESACTPSKYEPSAPTPPSTCATTKEICGNTLVCYGMVRHLLLSFTASTDAIQISDLKVDISPRSHVAHPPPNEHPIHFEPPRTLHHGSLGAPTGRLDDYGGKLLSGLAADDELVLQLSLSSAPIAPLTETKLPKNASHFLGVIIYGPRRRFSDVGEFVTQAGCYLDDPIDCDRNVPYMNPQCLFSLHEPLPMTFDLLQPQQAYMDDCTRVSLDFLSGFETTDELDLSASPTALCTELKMYVRCL